MDTPSAHDNERTTFDVSPFPFRVSRPILYSILLLLALSMSACGNLPIPIPGIGGAPTPSRQITYEGAVTLNARAGETIPGTTVAYQGRAADGRAILSIGGLQTLKATADSVKWSGALVLFSLVDLNMRVLTYDDSGMNLAGTIRIIVQEPNPTPGEIPSNPMANFLIPLSYTVSRGTNIPGTTVTYVGTKTNGAEFSNLDQIPFRDRFDSVVWQGSLRERIAVRYDLRVLDFNDDRVILGGTANVIFGP